MAEKKKAPTPTAAAAQNRLRASDPQSRDPQEDENLISRRRLLSGSAGLTLGSMALAGVGVGVAPGVARADHQPTPHGHRGHGSLAGSGSQRVYSVPPRLEDDVAHDPAAIPGPLPRREP